MGLFSMAMGVATKISSLFFDVLLKIFGKSFRMSSKIVKISPQLGWILLRIAMGIFFFVASIVAGITIYSLLYWWLIPSLHYSKPLYFDYTIQPYPRAMVNIATEQEYYLFNYLNFLYYIPFSSYIFNTKQSSNLISNQFYDISINLDIPNKPAMINNIEIGNFNLKLSLYSCKNANGAHTNNNKNNMNTEFKNIDINNDFDYELNEFINKYDLTLVKHIQRPIIIEYESSIINSIKKVVLFIPYAIGWFRDEQSISLQMMHSYQESKNNPTCLAVLTLSSKQFSIYSATVEFDVVLHGMQYFLYNWFFTASIVMISMMSFVSCLASLPLLIYFCVKVGKLQEYYSEENNNGDTNNDSDTMKSTTPGAGTHDDIAYQFLNKIDKFDSNNNNNNNNYRNGYNRHYNSSYSPFVSPNKRRNTNTNNNTQTTHNTNKYAGSPTKQGISPINRRFSPQSGRNSNKNNSNSNSNNSSNNVSPFASNSRDMLNTSNISNDSNDIGDIGGIGDSSNHSDAPITPEISHKDGLNSGRNSDENEENSKQQQQQQPSFWQSITQSISRSIGSRNETPPQYTKEAVQSIFETTPSNTHNNNNGKVNNSKYGSNHLQTPQLQTRSHSKNSGKSGKSGKRSNKKRSPLLGVNNNNDDSVYGQSPVVRGQSSASGAENETARGEGTGLRRRLILDPNDEQTAKKKS